MRVFLIDAMGLLFRSYYAMARAQLTTQQGVAIGAAFGFTKALVKILQELNPSHVVVAWDLKGKTFRHEMYTDYKAHRSPTPPELLPQVPLLKTLLEGLGIPMESCPGYEADDVIGTLALQAKGHGAQVFIVSADKDFMQLVGDGIHILSLKSNFAFEVQGEEDVQEYFGVKPHQVVDLLALLGDASDNVPGVKGIGPKGARALLQEFGTLQNLLDNTSKVANARCRTQLEIGRAEALLSKKLVTIHTAVPVVFNAATMACTLGHVVAQPRAPEALRHLNFTSIFNTLFPQKGLWEGATPAKPPPPVAGDPVAPAEATAAPWGRRDYHTIANEEELKDLLQRMATAPVMAFDTETTGLSPVDSTPIGWSVAFEVGQAYYVPVSPAHGTPGGLEAAAIWQSLQDALENRQGLLVAHNLKFDAHMTLNVGVNLFTKPYACSMVAAWVLNPGQGGYGLDAQTLSRLGLEKIPTKALLGKGVESMLQVPLATLGEYACEDADATLRLWLKLREELVAQEALWHLFTTMEMPLLEVLCHMEHTGVAIDGTVLGQLAEELQDRLSAIEKAVFDSAGKTFNLSSPRQLGQVLFEDLKVHMGSGVKVGTNTLGFKTDAATLDQFSDHPVVAMVQEYRELAKLLNTYVLKLPQLVSHSTGRIHTSFHQIGTATGRLSSSDPNLQNIPIRTNWGKRVRAAFTAPRPGWVLLSADYSQIELRVLAHLSQDPAMVEAFNQGIDIHAQTASKIEGKPLDQVTPDERSKAKAINFGIIYGMGAYRLARDRGIGNKEAKAFMDNYFHTFNRIGAYIDEAKQLAYKEGGARTLFGRWRSLEGLRTAPPREIRLYENMAVNTPIQGTAADLMKLGMVRLHKKLLEGKFQSKLLIQVHDEVLLEVPQEEIEAVTAVVKEALEQVATFSVPLTVDVGWGHSWLEA